jgi:hypothetical protein
MLKERSMVKQKQQGKSPSSGRRSRRIKSMLMKASTTWDDFMRALERAAPKPPPPEDDAATRDPATDSEPDRKTVKRPTRRKATVVN